METVNSDITIVGGGIAGMCAALAAARNGLKVALINDRPVLGGNASSEIYVSINGAASNGRSPSVYAREGGVIEEIKLTLKYYNTEKMTPAMINAAYFELIYREPDIQLYLNTVIHTVDVKNHCIKGVKGIQLRSEREYEFKSPLYADCSGDGIVGFKAGAHFLTGHEGRSEFGEFLAPEMAREDTMGNTILFWSRDAGKKVEYRRPGFAYDITKMEFFKNLGNERLHRMITRQGRHFEGYWWIEYGGLLDTVRDDQEITLELQKLVYGFWDYIKNSGDFEDVDTLELDFMAPIPGKRESRRFIGDYILTQRDIDSQTVFPDAVCHGGWPMDVHAPKGIYDDRPATHWYPVKGIYSIPFRSLYSRSIANLMLAGRNISASHVAMGSTRVIATCGCMGQAVGTAALLCKRYDCMPRLVAADHIEELQYLLQRNDQAIIGKNENDDTDFLKDLQIHASTTREYCNMSSDGKMALDRDLCLSLPILSEKLVSLDIMVSNTSSKMKLLKYEIWGGNKPENYSPENKLGEHEVAIAGLYDGWATIPVNCNRPADSKIHIIFPAQDGLELYYTKNKLTGVVTSEYNDKSEQLTSIGYLRLVRLEENLCFGNVAPRQDIYTAANVINGFSRPYGLPNLWISEAIQTGCEEYINLKYEIPKNISEIHLIFNSMLEEDNLYLMDSMAVPTLVKEYSIEATNMEGVKKIIDVRDNFLRFRRHKLELSDIVNIRIGFGSTNGSPYYEVYGIKLF